MTERPAPEDSGPPDDAACFRFANVEFDEPRGELRVAGKPVTLEPRVRRLLGELLRHTNEVVTKDELYRSVWDERPTVDHAYASAVSKLRSALGPEAAARIVTVPRVGYRLDGPVQRVESAAPHLSLQAGHAVPGRPAYLLERALGRGGHADVWLGRHAKLGHSRVFKFAAEGSRLGALRREFTLNRLLAQALGPRDDLAAVVDAQFHSEPFFLECTYGGQNLQDWADRPEQPLAALALDQRIALFNTLVRAVADAHGVGVLHKDLKPGNVLIAPRAAPADPAAASPTAAPPNASPTDAAAAATATTAPMAADPRPPRADDWQIRLTDFGSGRLLDRSLLQGLNLTALGLSHTLDASDSSISGTLMYLAPEVLAGQAASVRSDVYALGVMLYQWVVADLKRPMATGWERDIADPLLRADIAAATDGRPEARLATAAELAQRLATLDARRTAAARQQAAQAEQARQADALARSRARRPWVLAAFAALALGLALGAWQLLEARAAQRRSDEALKISQATLAFLTDDVLTTPDVARSGGNQPKPLLELARQGARRAGERFAGLPLQEAAARAHLARTFARLWATDDAWQQFDKAEALLTPLLPADDEWLLTLQFEHSLLDFALGSHTYPNAQRRVAAALQAAGAPRLAQPTPLAVLAGRAQVAMLNAEGRDSAAVAAGRALVALADRLPEPSAPGRIEARHALAVALITQDDMAAADQVLAQLDQPPLNALPESAFAMADAHTERARHLHNAGRLDEAKKLLNAVLQRLDRAPAPSLWHRGHAHANLAQVHQKAGEPAAAAQHHQAALDNFRPALGDGHVFVLNTAFNLGRLWLDLGRVQDAVALCRDSEAWAKAQRPDGLLPGREAMCGRALLAAGQPAQALKHLQSLPPPGPNDLPTGVERRAWETQALKGLAMEQTGQVVEGQRLLAEARQMLARFDHLPTGIALLDARFAKLK